MQWASTAILRSVISVAGTCSMRTPPSRCTGVWKERKREGKGGGGGTGKEGGREGGGRERFERLGSRVTRRWGACRNRELVASQDLCTYYVPVEDE
jgi:hypothetical protein